MDTKPVPENSVTVNTFKRTTSAAEKRDIFLTHGNIHYRNFPIGLNINKIISRERK
jgi:hypothetical protein